MAPCIFSQSGVQLVSACSRTVPQQCLIDGPRIRQVLSNGITNAIKMTPRGEILIRVSAIPPASASLLRAVSTEDDGAKKVTPTSVSPTTGMKLRTLSKKQVAPAPTLPSRHPVVLLFEVLDCGPGTLLAPCCCAAACLVQCARSVVNI